MIDLQTNSNFLLLLKFCNEITLIVIFLLAVCFVKPFFARGWLIAAAFFFTLASLQNAYVTFFREAFLDKPFELQAIFYFTLMPILEGLAKFSLLMFLFMFFMKRTYNVNLDNFLFSCKGRSSRLQYWFMIFIISALTTPMVYSFSDIWLNLVNNSGYSISGIYLFASAILLIIALVVLWISLAISIKRWHDCNKSAWYSLLLLIPVVGIFISMLYLGTVRGTQGNNRYGVDPLNNGDNE